MAAQVPVRGGLFALVDDEDAAWCRSHLWHRKVNPSGCIYVKRALSPGRFEYLHRMVVGALDGEFVDHINGDGLDCRKQNLRICSKADNNRNRAIARNNTSGVPGVSFMKSAGLWRAYLNVTNRQVSLGVFRNKDEAIAARRAGERKFFGEFAPSVCRA